MLFQKELAQAKEVLEYFKKEFEKMRLEQIEMMKKVSRIETDIDEIKKQLSKRSSDLKS